MALTLIDIDPRLSLVLALALGAFGLRYIAHPLLISAACSTAAVLLILPVSAHDIQFRAEAALGVVAISGAMFGLLSVGWRLVERVRQHDRSGQP